MFSLTTIRLIGDAKVGEINPTIANYLVEDYSTKQPFYESLAAIPSFTLFRGIPGFGHLSLEDKTTFCRTIYGYCRSQGRNRLANTTVSRVVRNPDEVTIRVYLTEPDYEYFQYFYDNGGWD